MSETKIIGFLPMVRYIKKEARNIQEVLFSSNLSYEEIVRIITEKPKKDDFLELKLTPNKKHTAILKIDSNNLFNLSEEIKTEEDPSNFLCEIFIPNLEQIFNKKCLGKKKNTYRSEIFFPRM